MIQPCNFLAPNGEKSDLAQSLIEQHGPNKAIAVWDNLHSDDVLEYIHDWKSDSRWNTEAGELTPEVATYVHNLYTARNEWNKLKADTTAGEVKIRTEYYHPSAEQLLNNYIGSSMREGKDLRGRTQYKVIIPLPKFSDEYADKIASGDKDYVEAMKAPTDYITPDIPEMEITPKLDQSSISGLAKGTENMFTQKSSLDMAQGDRALVYINGKPMIATYQGESTDIAGAHNFSVSNPYTKEDITSRELGIDENTKSPSLASDSPQLHESLGRMFAQVRDDEGKAIPGKYFTSEQQNSAVDAVMTDLYGYVRNSLKNGDNLTANLLLSGLKMTRAKLRAFDNGLQGVMEGDAPDSFLWNDLSPEEAQQRSGEIQNVLKSYDQIAKFTLERLKCYGFGIKDSIVSNITDYLNKSQDVDTDDNGLDVTQDVDITGTEGRGLKDWTDSSFELDPRDTASKRMKFFLANIKDAEFGKEEPAKRVRMIFADPEITASIANGTKVYTVRTPEQAERIKLGTDGKGSIVLDGKTFTVEEHKYLPDEEALSHWTDVFNEEKVDPEPGSIVYKLTKFEPKDNVLVNKKSSLGFPRLAPFDQVFTDILAQVQDSGELSYQGFRDTLAKSGNPTMMRVAQEIDGSDQQLKNEFFKVFSKQYQRMRTVLFNIRQFGTEQRVSASTISSNRFNEIDTLIGSWREQQKISPLISSQDGRLEVNSEVAKAHLDQFKKITSFDWSKANESTNTRLATWTKDFLSDIGIDMTDEAINDFRQNAIKLTKGTQFAGSWYKQYSMTTDGKPNGVISALVTRLNGLATPDEQLDSETNPEEEFLRNNNPLYTENTALRILAKAQAKFTGNLFAPMHKNGEGKSIYAYGLRTYESRVFDSLKNSEEYRNQFNDIPFAKDSWLLGKLKSASGREKMELNYLDSLKAAYRKGGGTTRPDMSPREQEFLAITMFQNKGNKLATFLDMTKSDKSTTPVIYGVEKEPVKGFKLSATMSTAFTNVFNSEFNRIRHWEDNKDSFNNKQYVSGGGLFYMMPQFNFEEMSKDLKSGKISREQFASIWNDNGTIARTEDVITRNEVAAKYTGEFIRNLGRDTAARWRKMGLFDDEQTKFDDSWTKKALANLLITSEKDAAGNTLYSKVEGGQLVPITKAAVNKLVGSLAALEYSTHYFLHNTSMSQIISGDPALNYKGKASDSQIKQVSDTMKEYQKRLAKDIAPGSDPAWAKGASYRSLTIADPNYHSYLGDIIPAYDSFDTAADAQEVTTTQEHLDTMFAEGKIPDKVYHEMTQIVTDGSKQQGGYYEFTKPEHKQVILQAMKPVQAGAKFGSGLMEVNYIKTSSYPLLPEMTRGLEIDNLRLHMENQGIQRAVFKSGVKAGAPNESAQVFDNEGKFRGAESIPEDSVQTLSRDGFRIQQEVPYDEEKGKILTVSQMNKLITEGIEHLEGFSMPGHPELNGQQMRELKEQTRIQMFDIQRHQYLESVGAEPTEEGGYTFRDQGKMLKRLEQEAITRNYPANDLDAIRTKLSDGRLVLPLFLNGSADKFESLMMSLIKQVVTVKMPGKSFIQASSLGYKGHEFYENLTSEQKNSIIYTEGFDPKQGLRSLDKGANGKVKAAQVFVPFNFTGKDGKVLDVMKFTKQTEDGRTAIDDTKLPPELRRFVGARIPNQEHSSMLPIEIAGFIPKQMGDLMIVPAEITQQMGSDFDVDKLYVYRPGYTHDSSSGVLAPQDMATDPEKHGDNMNMSQLQQQYFNIHWSILTHPEMFDRILTPLDKPELKNEKALAEEGQDKGIRNYYSANNQFDDFMSQKDAKTLVGATAVNNTFNAVIQDKNLRLGHTEMTEEGPREVEDSIDIKDEFGREMKLTRLSGTGKAEYYNGEDPAKADTPTIRTKANNISSELSEVVDHAKNRTIDALNLNEYTFPATAGMNILETKEGKALSLKYVRLLQMEPVVEYSQRMASGNDSLSTEFTQDLRTKTFADLAKEYQVKAGPEFDPEKKLLLSPKDMLDLIRTPEDKKNEEYYGKQYHALELFRRFEEVGTTMRQIQSKFNQDTRGAGSDLLASLNTQADLPSTLRNGVILGVEGIGGELGKGGVLKATTEAGHTFTNTVELANQLYPELLPYKKLQPLFGSISLEMGRDKITTDNQRRVSDAVRNSLMASSRNGLFENATRERAKLLFDTDAGPSLARRLAEVQSTWGRDNYFLARLATHIAARDEQESTITYNATGASSLDDMEITKAWAAMLTSDNPEEKALAEDLVRYTYATGGMQSAQNFVRFVPVGYLAGLPMAKELNNQVDSLERAAVGPRAMALTQQIFQHNPDMAMQLKGDFSQVQGHETTPPIHIPEFFFLDKDVTNTELPASSLMINTIDASGKPQLRYPDFLSVRNSAGTNSWLLYKRVQEYDGSTEFQRIDTLGKGDTLEYDPDRQYTRSVFPDNRALYPLQESAGMEMAQTPAEHVRDIASGTQTAEDFGITPEGSDFDEVITNMLTHQDVSSESQNLLGELYNLATATSKTVAEQPLPLISTTVDSDKVGAFTYSTEAGRYKNPRIALNLSKLRTPEDAVRVMTHELTHYNTGLVLRGYEEYMKNGASIGGPKPEWLTPGVSDAIHNIDMVRLRAQNEFEKDAASDKSLAYAFGSSSEFISAAFENKKLQDLLNSKPASDVTSKTIMQTIIDGIHDIVKAIGDYLGVPVKSGSMLDETLRHSMIIMGASSEQPKYRGGDDSPSSGEHTEGMSYFGSEDIEESHSPEIRSALGKLTTLRDKLQSKQILPSDRRMDEAEGREYQLRGAEINRLEYEIKKLNTQSTLHSLISIGDRQMKTIDSMLTEPKLSTKQLENLLDTTDTWEHMIDDIYDSTTNGNVPKEAQVLRGQAAERKAKIMNLVKQTEINDPESVINSLSDFDAEQMKTGPFKAYAVDLSRTSSMVAQRIDGYLKSSTRLAKEEARRTRAELNDYQAKLGAYAKRKGTTPEKVFDKMMQKGDSKWGLVHMFSDDYYNFKRKARASLFAKLTHTDAMDGLAKQEAVKDAYAKYRDTINKNVVYVDTSKMFDDKTGELMDTPEAKAHKAQLDKELGKDLADTMVQKAQDNFGDYLRDRYSYKSAIQVQVQSLLADHEDEVNSDKSLTPKEKGAKIEAFKQELTGRFNDEYNTWEGHHSPNVFFRSMRGEYRGFNPKFNNFGAIVDAPRATAEDGKDLKFYDKDFRDIQEDPELREMYGFIKSKMDQFKSNLPSHVTEDMDDTFLPYIRKELKLGVKDLGKTVQQKLTDAISMEDSLVEWARTDSGMVPIRYTNPKGVDAEERERNIFRMLEKFGRMSTHYKRAIEVQSGVELLHRIMVDKIQDTKGGMFDRVNNGTKNLSDMVAYAKDKLLYEKSKLPEGELGNLYSLNPIKQFKLEKQVVALKDQIAELDEKYAEGDMDPAEYHEQKNALMNKIAAIPHSQILASKLGDAAIKLTELKTLSYNPFSAFANVSFGLVSTMIHANGRVDFDKKTAMNAFTTMLSATKRAVTGGALDSSQARKILSLMDKYDVMGDLLDSDFAGESRIQGQKNLAQKLSSPYQLLRNSDYFMKGMILVAMMKTHSVDVGGKQVKLWDAYDNEGNWKEGENKQWVSDNPEEETEFRKFQSRAIQVGKTIMGNQDHASTMMIKKTVLGRLISQFRGTWLSEGFNSRFEDERFDSQLGRQVKGRYRTYNDLGVMGSIGTLFRQGMSTFLNIDPFTGRKRNGEKLNDTDIENMRRNFAEAASYLTVMAAVIALRQQLQNQDKDSPEAKRSAAIGQTLLNLVIRNRQDIETFASPDVVNNITSSLVPAMKVWIDFKRATTGTVKYLGQNDESKNPIKGEAVTERWMKSLPYTAIYPKFKTMWTKDMDNVGN